MAEQRSGMLALADGRIFRGRAIGSAGTVVGEVVFTTSMSGYQEVLGDPSYAGQIVAMTCAEIGNVGTNDADRESDGVKAAGLIVRSSLALDSSWRSECPFHEFLRKRRVVAVEEIDTRALVIHIRSRGAQMGALSSEACDPDVLVRRARDAAPMAGRNLAREVSCKTAYDWRDPPDALQAYSMEQQGLHSVERRCDDATMPFVVAYDFGIKWSILRRLVEAGARVRVVPADTPAEDVLAMSPDGIFLSNGPGDPAPCTEAIAAVRKLVGKKPIFGICLGHQILGLAYGARSFKLPFGHRGSNQPVADTATGRVRITSQNHGFAIDPGSFSSSGPRVHVSEINLNDQTLEGFEVASDRVMAVQYHPEASPGPHDSSDHFRRFVRACMRD